LKKKLLIFGVSGLTGYKIVNTAQLKYEIYGTFNKRPIDLPNCSVSKIDLTNEHCVTKLFSEIKPDLVINTTALHNVDYCEENKNEALATNSKAIETLYNNSEKQGSKLIHISTDYVFDGNSTKPYTENDPPKPISVYGESKLKGEKFLEDSNHVILRPSVVFGWTPLELSEAVSSSGKSMNFAIWLLTKLSKNEQLKIVTDQFATATLADSLANSALKIAESSKSGLYHISGLSCESRYEFSIKFAEKFGFDSSLISKTSSSQFKQKAKRPAYSCLNCQKAIKDFGLKLLTTEKALDIMKEQVMMEAPQFLNDL